MGNIICIPRPIPQSLALLRRDDDRHTTTVNPLNHRPHKATPDGGTEIAASAFGGPLARVIPARDKPAKKLEPGKSLPAYQARPCDTHMALLMK